jgi:hypothetical protein
VRRHDLDLASLLSGLVFIAVAVAGLAGADLDLRWLLPTVLVLLAVAGLSAVLQGRRRIDRD